MSSGHSLPALVNEHPGGRRSALGPTRYAHEQGVTRITNTEADATADSGPDSSPGLGLFDHHRAGNIPRSLPTGVSTTTSVLVYHPQPRWANLPSDDVSGFQAALAGDRYESEVASDTSSNFPLPSVDSRMNNTGSAPNREPKTRHEKSRIQLAPDQPLTTQGKPRTRVYVACIQCRARKIRCDGAKPLCHNCGRRPDGDSQCSYDPVPKRRGPDKTPGGRHRGGGQEGAGSQSHRRTRRRVEELRTSDMERQRSTSLDESKQDVEHELTIPGIQLLFPVPHTLRGASSSSSGSFHEQPCDGRQPTRQSKHDFAPNLQEYVEAAAHSSHASQTTPPSNSRSEEKDARSSETGIGAEPSLQHSRKTWWDALINLYSLPSDHLHGHPTPNSPTLRDATVQHITGDLRFLFRVSTHWLSFLHAPRFFARFQDGRSRAQLQPSLLLGALAVAALLRGSEPGQASQRKERAIRLRDEAQSALEASLSARWVDQSLVQASCILAIFEFCAHPLHSMARVRSSLTMLDSLIRYLSLTSLDAGDPRVVTFPPRSAPTYPSLSENSRPHDYPGGKVSPHNSDLSIRDCLCSTYTLGHRWPGSMELTPLWAETPTWIGDWSEDDIRKEECRRLVWCSVMLAAGYSNYMDALEDGPVLDLFVTDPANFALLLPGESLSRSNSIWLRESAWALYARSMLLWNSCMRMRGNPAFSDVDKAQFAVAAWLEIDTIEEALSTHTCNVERTHLFVGREYLLNSRACIFSELERYIPQSIENANVVKRKKTEEWFTYQASMANRIVNGLHAVTGQPTSNLSECPFYLFWFMSQVARMLTLYGSDSSLSVALDASSALFSLVDYLMALWPCPEQRRACERLRCRFSSARSRAVQDGFNSSSPSGIPWLPV
ncbi:hypothetical protein BKA93DRAFT_928995 [Sparassis latifolia]